MLVEFCLWVDAWILQSLGFLIGIQSKLLRFLFSHTLSVTPLQPLSTTYYIMTSLLIGYAFRKPASCRSVIISAPSCIQSRLYKINRARPMLQCPNVPSYTPITSVPIKFRSPFFMNVLPSYRRAGWISDYTKRSFQKFNNINPGCTNWCTLLLCKLPYYLASYSKAGTASE
jgi:hypothetical protein